MAPLSHTGSGAQTDGGQLERDDFDRRVAELLDQRGRSEVASWTLDNASNSRALGPSDVAREESLERTEANVEAVADAVEAGYQDTLESLREGDR